MTDRAPSARLTEAAVRAIRYKHGHLRVPVRLLAREYGVAVETVRRILRWESWGWVGEEGAGATAEDWSRPAGVELPNGPQELLRRLQAQGLAPTVEDEEARAARAFARLNEEAQRQARPDQLLKELEEGKK